MGFIDDNNDESVTVTLDLDDGRTLECQVITVFEADSKNYIALLPLDGEEAEKGEVYLYRYKDDKGEPTLEYIDSDDEYEAASDAFDEYLDTVEFDELITDEEVES